MDHSLPQDLLVRQMDPIQTILSYDLAYIIKSKIWLPLTFRTNKERNGDMRVSSSHSCTDLPTSIKAVRFRNSDI